MPHAAKREADLRKLAETLDRASRLAEKVRQDNVGSELVSHLIEGILPREPRGRMVLGEDGSLRADFYPETDFKQMIGRLKDYQPRFSAPYSMCLPGYRGLPPVCRKATSARCGTSMSTAQGGLPGGAQDRFCVLSCNFGPH